MVIGWNNWPEWFGSQWTGDFGRPIIVRGVRVETIVADGRHQAVELGSKPGLKVSSGIHGVHGVAFSLPPFGSTVLEPNLQQ